MKLANCPSHGRTCLTNAGVPNLVRCAIIGTTFEPCRRCRGNPVAGGEMLPDDRGPVATTYCPDCTHSPHPGWAVYPGKAGGVYPVS